MKIKLSYSLIKNVLNCFFLLKNKKFNQSYLNTSFCMFQHNRELKQLIKVLLTFRKKRSRNSFKVSVIVLHVEDSFSKNLLTSLINQFNFKVKIQVELLSAACNPYLFSSATVLNLYFIENKAFNPLELKKDHLTVVFQSIEPSFKIKFSGSYLVSSSTFDIKFFIFIVALLNSFLTKDYEKMCKI
jgi:hypothetical protein